MASRPINVMNSILVASESREAAEHGLRTAADLSVACGARLVLACVRPETGIDFAHTGLDAIAHLSDVLFAPRDWRTPTPAFAAAAQASPDWISEMQGAVDECWIVDSQDALVAQLAASRPALVIAHERKMANRLMLASSVPVWRIGESSMQKPWFSIRTLRCSARGAKSVSWARNLAASLGAELELSDSNADLTVVSREKMGTALRFFRLPARQSVVVV
jgi:hypothetical protein